MNENAIIKMVPAAAELRKVPNFDPLNYLKRTVSPVTGEQVWKLDLDFKKLWFKLACPDGRMVYNNLRITDQMAMIEARVFTNRDDPEPLSNFTATVYASARPGCYVQSAQEEALNEALDNAGFGIQLCDLTAPGNSLYGSEIPVSQVEATLGMRQVGSAGMPAQKKTVKPAPASERVPMKTPSNASAVEQTSTVPMKQEMEKMPVETLPTATERSDTPSVVPAEQVTATPSEKQIVPQKLQSPAADPEKPQTAPTEKISETVVMDFPVQTAQAEATTETATVHVEEIDQESGDKAEVGSSPVSYTEDMSVEEICQRMTLEEALNFVVDFGTCKGWTVGQVAEQRAASLKFYLSGHSNAGNILRAAATLALSDRGLLKKAG